MTSERRPIIAAVSGPDDVGKSTLIRRMAPMLRERGFETTTTYCYGCLVCRQFQGPPRWRDGTSASGSRELRVLGSWVDRAHASVDAAELTIRLLSAILRVKMRAHGRPAAVVTDRGPLDGLVKYGPAPDSVVARLFTGLARRHDITFLLDFDRGPETRERRVKEEAWPPYRLWAPRLPSIVRLDAGSPPAAMADEAVRRLLRKATGNRRRRIVISSFDSAGNPWYGGGGAAVVEKVARRLASEYRVTVVTAARHWGTRTQGSVTYLSVPVFWAGPRAGQLLFKALLPFITLRLPHDLWIESFTPPFSTGLLPLLTRRPVIGIDQLRAGEAMSRKYHLPFFLVERLGLRLYRNLVVMNEADAEAVRRLSPKASVQVIENGVEHQIVEDDRLGQGDHILFLGRIEMWEKGLDLLLAASAKGGLALPLLLAGSGAEAEEKRLRAMVADQDHVQWLGHVSGEYKRQLLENSAFLVLPSRHETFGLAALEGMSYGKPVLHFDLPPLRWMHGGGGVDVQPFDVDLLAERMRRLAADPDWRRRLGRTAYRTAQRHSWGHMTGHYLTLVQRVLDGRPDSHADERGSASWSPIR
jgi:glycosyltransferase involved in cell wall biosynthesis